MFPLEMRMQEMIVIAIRGPHKSLIFSVNGANGQQARLKLTACIQERWLSLLHSEADLEELPETLDVRLKAEEFQNYAQQMENAVLSLAISVEEVKIAVLERRLNDASSSTSC